MRNLKKYLLLLPVFLLSSMGLSSCDSSSDVRVLRILNSEDYIYETCDEYVEDGMSELDMIDQFKEYWFEKTGEEIDVVYDTFDTNETMFNELQTGKTTYDIVVPSDYMVQKLLSYDMIEPFDEDKKDEIWQNISAYLKGKFNDITSKKLNVENAKDEAISNYSIPYMWGTVGVMYNPEKYENLSEDEVHELFKDWDSLYGEELRGSFSIKDSVRDTYAVSLIHNFLKSGDINSSIDNAELTDIFNRNDVETMAKVKEDMLELKENAFGFECDSGKTDMTTKKIGANICWSGDATWAITVAEDENAMNLYYSIPTSYNGEEGAGASNIWFDCFCMPKSDDLQKDLAQEFMIFMSDPENAMENCYAVGYTPGVAGEAMLDYILGEYEANETLAYYEECLAALNIDDFDTIDEYVAEKESLEESIETEKAWISQNEGTTENYYDLRYFYGEDCDKAYFLPSSSSIGRQLTAQYPDAKDLDRLAIMNDFGPEGNQRLLDTWEQVRTNPLPTWGFVLFAIEGVFAISLAIYFINHNISRKRFKRERALKL